LSGPAALVVVTTTLATEEAARELARAVVSERLAACVHLVPITSVYHWDGALRESAEWACQIKTTPERLEALIARVAALHPYEVPEILAVPVLAAHLPYLQWVARSVADG